MEKEYKYGEPDEYGDFPYLYAGRYKDDELNDILRERLPENFNMSIVDPVEEQVLSDLSTIGIDSHLEAIVSTKDELVDRTVGNKVVCRSHDFDFTPSGMICLIRRLNEYNPRDYRDFYGDVDEYGETEEEKEYYEAAYNLRSCILEVLKIETM